MPPRNRNKNARCPRCKSVRMEKRLDGARWCARCGQRIARDGRLIPSADRRSGEQNADEQLILI